MAFRYHQEDSMSDLKINAMKLAQKVRDLKAEHKAKKNQEQLDYLRYCSGYEQYNAPVPDFSKLGF